MDEIQSRRVHRKSFHATSSDVPAQRQVLYGMSPFPEVSDIVDLNDDQKRTVTYKVTANGNALLEGQTVTPESYIWVNPFTTDRDVEHGDPVIEFVRAADRAAVDQPPIETLAQQTGLLTRFRQWLAGLINPA